MASSSTALKLIAVYTSVSQRDDARRMARTIVERQLAACAQITEMESFYRWQGAVQNETEWRILFKTAASHYARIESAIRELHPYELPAIHAVPVEQAYEPYERWVIEASSAAES